MNRANAATDPEMSAMTNISGFDGSRERNFGSIGTPPVESECRIVERKSSGPRARGAASAQAGLRAFG